MTGRLAEKTSRYFPSNLFCSFTEVDTKKVLEFHGTICVLKCSVFNGGEGNSAVGFAKSTTKIVNEGISVKCDVYKHSVK